MNATPVTSPIAGSADMQLLSRLREHARLRPESRAVSLFNPATGAVLVTTYADLASRVDSFAGWLRSRFVPGTVIALAAPAQEGFVVTYLGALAAGLIIHPIPQNSSVQELLAFVSTTSASVLVGDSAALAAAAAYSSIERVPIDALPTASNSGGIAGSPGAPGLYLPSSGTTGLPKIAVRSRGALDAVAANVALAANLTPEDCVLAAVPLSHSYGMENGLLGPIWAGSCIRILDRAGGFDVGEMLTELGSGEVTVFPAVPFMLDVLAKLAADHAVRTKLRLTYTAGAPLPPSVATLFESRFGMAAGQLYGATEVGSVTFGAPDRTRDPQCVGGPLPGVSILILDTGTPDLHRPLPPGTEGQVAIRATSMLSYYLGGSRGDPAFLGDYFLTGDLGIIDERGSLTITGRLKLLIDVGGFKVNPLEVERLLAQHPSVAEVVVLPMPVSETVSRLRAVITPSGDHVPIDELRALAKSKLAPHKIPRIFDVVDRLPKSPTGKILRRQLESMK